MRNLLQSVFLICVLWLQLSGVSLGKEVFLRDGGTIDCEAFWKHNDQIVVKVNRDVILEFERGEIDIPKTFHSANKKPRRITRQKRISHPAAQFAVPTAGQAPLPSPLTAVAPAKTATAAVPAPALTSTPAANPVAAKTAAAAPAVAKGVSPPASNLSPNQVVAQVATSQPEPAAENSPASATVLTKEELRRRAKENGEMVAVAIRKKDPELLKKALEAQRNLIQQQKNAPPMPEPPWFKYLLMLFASGLFIIISLWVIFEKAGQPGVKSLIPFYNTYVLMELSGKPGWWFILLLIPGVGIAIYLIAMISLAEKFGRSSLFAVGLVLLPMCFFPLLAFGGSKYQDPVEEMNFTFSVES